MKKTTLERLSRYSAVAAAVTAALPEQEAKAQIIYTDVNPDVSVVDSGVYLVDFNLDNSWDVGFAASVSSSVGLVLGGINSSFSSVNGLMFQVETLMVGGSTTTFQAVQGLDAGDVIGPTGNFGTSSMFLAVVGSYYGQTFGAGQFLNTVDKFVGCRFLIGADVHYGWVRLSCDASGSQFTVKDYAYNLTVNEPIEAGATPGGGNITGIAEGETANLSINFSNNLLQVTNAGAKEQGELKVYDMNGSEVITEPLAADGGQVQVAQLAPGVYLARIRYGTALLSKKIVVQ